MDAQNETATVRVVVTAPDVRIVDAVLSQFLVWWNTEGHTTLVVSAGGTSPGVTWHSSRAVVSLPVTFTRSAVPAMAAAPAPLPVEPPSLPEIELVDEFFSEADVQPRARTTGRIAGLLQPLGRRGTAWLRAGMQTLRRASGVAMLVVASFAASGIALLRASLARCVRVVRMGARRAPRRIGPPALVWTGVGAAVLLIVALAGWPNPSTVPADTELPPPDDRTIVADIVTAPPPPRAIRSGGARVARAAVVEAGARYVMQPAAARRALFTGTLQVVSEPEGAEVTIDGTLVGTTPVRVERVPAGSHAVLLTLPGHQRWTSAARVVSGEPNRLVAVLEPVSEWAPAPCAERGGLAAPCLASGEEVRTAGTAGIEGESPEP